MTTNPLLPPLSQELTLSTFQQAASDAKEQFRVEAAAIRENPRLTTVGKQEALNELRERTRAVIKDAEIACAVAKVPQSAVDATAFCEGRFVEILGGDSRGRADRR